MEGVLGGDLMAKNGSLAVNNGLVVEAFSNGWLLYVHGLSSIVEQFSTVSESKLQRASTSGLVGDVALNTVPTAKTRLATVLLESGLFLDLSSVTVLLESGLFFDLSSVTVLLESGLFLNLSSVRPDEGFFIGL